MTRPRSRGAQLALDRPVEDLLRMAEGRPVRVPLRERWRRVVCAIFGHQTVIDRWVPARLGSSWEHHVGCLRCDRLVTLPGNWTIMPGDIEL